MGPETLSCYFSTVIPTGLAELVAIMSYLWAYIPPQRSQRPDHVGKCCLIMKSQEWGDKENREWKSFTGEIFIHCLKTKTIYSTCWSACPHIFSYSKTKPFSFPSSPTPVPLPPSLLGRWPSLASLHDTDYLSNLQDEISHLLKAVLWLLTHPSIPPRPLLLRAFPHK